MSIVVEKKAQMESLVSPDTSVYPATSDQGTMRAILGTISKTGVQLLFIVLSVHVNECYITRKRGVALGICTTLSRLGAIIAPTLKSLVSADR